MLWPLVQSSINFERFKIISKAIQVSNESSAKGGESAWARDNNKPSPFLTHNHGWLSAAGK